MHRTLAGTAAIIGILLVPILAYGTDVTLDELVSWPLLSAGIPAQEVELEEEPCESLAGLGTAMESAVGEIAFGVLPIGNGPDSQISFVLDLGEPAALIVDANNNEDLGDDEWVPVEQIGSRSYTWFFNVSVEYSQGNGIEVVETHVNLTALYSYVEDRYIVGYSNFAHREGVAMLNGDSYPISVTTLLADGVYEVDQLVVAVDSDQNGIPDSLPGSHEVFGPGELVHIGEEKYEIASISPSGTAMQLALVGTANPLPVIRRGAIAPDFETTTVTGERLALSDLRGEVAVLLFFPQFEGTTACMTCVSTDYNLQRLDAIYQATKSIIGANLVVIVSTDMMADDLEGMPSRNVVYVDDPLVPKLYRRSYGVIVVAPDGAIAAMDEAWMTFKCDRPQGSMDELRSAEIAAIAERLLRLPVGP